MRTVVTFRSTAFNTSQPQAYFINPGCFGDDVCRWLIQRLRARRVETDPEPDQEDFGWFLNFSVPDGKHCFVVGYRPADDGEMEGNWIGWVERRRGFVGSLLGGRRRGIAVSALQAIHGALSGAPEIRNVLWHRQADFDRGQEDLGRDEPEAV